MVISRWIPNRMRNASDKICNFCPKIVGLWGNVDSCRAGQAAVNITRRMRLNKARHSGRMCNTLSFSSATVVTRTHLSVTFIGTLPALFVCLCVRKDSHLPHSCHVNMSSVIPHGWQPCWCAQQATRSMRDFECCKQKHLGEEALTSLILISWRFITLQAV